MDLLKVIFIVNILGIGKWSKDIRGKMIEKVEVVYVLVDEFE